MTLGRDESCAPRVVYFNRAVRELVPLLRRLLGENIRILTDLAEGPGLVGISLAQAQQIILNLALNARDAMPTGGSVRLETRFRQFEGTGPGERIFEFTACDTGEGMDAQIASRIFDLFSQPNRPTAAQTWDWPQCARLWKMQAELCVSRLLPAKARE
jgi:two-component system, cell cycle sensor histidine kinase and response regulator CckA